MYNASGVVRILIALGGIAGALWLSMSILQDRNLIGSTFKYLMIFGFLMGVVFPRIGMGMFIFECFYLDFFKRLLTLSGNFSGLDLYFVLGVAPLTLLGVCVHLMLGWLAGARNFSWADWIRLVIAAALCAVIFLAAWTTGGGRSLGEAVNGAAYASLLWVIPLLHPDRESLLKYIRLFLLAGIPMALYGIIQAFYGFSEVEIRYIQTGATILSKTYYAMGEEALRAFGTLNHHSTFGAVTGVLFLLALLYVQAEKRRGLPVVIFWLMIALVFLTANVVSENRSTYLIPVAGIIGMVLFRHPLTTAVLYVAGFSGLLGLVLRYEWFANNLVSWNQTFLGSYFGQHFGTLGTFIDRLRSFATLHNPDAWTPFGLKRVGSMTFEGGLFAHDAFTLALLTVGYVPLAGILLILLGFVVYIHRRINRITDRDLKSQLCTLMAAFVALLGAGVLYGQLLQVFPTNVFMWLLVSSFIVFIRKLPLPGPEANHSGKDALTT